MSKIIAKLFQIIPTKLKKTNDTPNTIPTQTQITNNFIVEDKRIHQLNVSTPTVFTPYRSKSYHEICNFKQLFKAINQGQFASETTLKIHPQFLTLSKFNQNKLLNDLNIYLTSLETLKWFKSQLSPHPENDPNYKKLN